MPDNHLYLYNEITDPMMAGFGYGVSSEMLIQALASFPADEEIMLHINSPGGIATEGIAMRDALLERGNVIARVEGIAASAGTVVAIGAKEVQITDASRFMIHQASGSLWNATESEIEMYLSAMTSLNETLAHLYSEKSGKPVDHFTKILNPGKYYSAKQAVKEGLVDKIVKAGSDKKTKHAPKSDEGKSDSQSADPSAKLADLAESEAQTANLRSRYEKIQEQMGFGSISASSGGIRSIMSPFSHSLIQITSMQANMAQLLGIRLDSEILRGLRTSLAQKPPKSEEIEGKEGNLGEKEGKTREKPPIPKQPVSLDYLLPKENDGESFLEMAKAAFGSDW